MTFKWFVHKVQPTSPSLLTLTHKLAVGKVCRGARGASSYVNSMVMIQPGTRPGVKTHA